MIVNPSSHSWNRHIKRQGSKARKYFDPHLISIMLRGIARYICIQSNIFHFIENTYEKLFAFMSLYKIECIFWTCNISCYHKACQVN